jgi:hypothetical protein
MEDAVRRLAAKHSIPPRNGVVIKEHKVHIAFPCSVLASGDSVGAEGTKALKPFRVREGTVVRGAEVSIHWQGLASGRVWSLVLRQQEGAPCELFLVVVAREDGARRFFSAAVHAPEENSEVVRTGRRGARVRGNK